MNYRISNIDIKRQVFRRVSVIGALAAAIEFITARQDSIVLCDVTTDINIGDESVVCVYYLKLPSLEAVCLT